MRRASKQCWKRILIAILLFMAPFLKERTFSLSAWLCGLYGLPVPASWQSCIPFLSEKLLWFSSCKLLVFRISFPQESFGLFKFTVPFQTDNFWNVRIFDCRIRICPTPPSRDVKQGLCFSVASCLKWRERLHSWCQVSSGGQWPTASYRTAALLVFQLLPTHICQSWVWDPRP